MTVKQINVLNRVYIDLDISKCLEISLLDHPAFCDEPGWYRLKLTVSKNASIDEPGFRFKPSRICFFALVDTFPR